MKYTVVRLTDRYGVSNINDYGFDININAAYKKINTFEKQDREDLKDLKSTYEVREVNEV